ncbi:hypothetical protein Anas_01921 [Armadillidium nasatum]|uniref:Uncharacterized protein n=1 Tax=Armadillidium nasatum TaxID=96803 RepID=A0A5N5T1Q5_9CRUS|nr:hypothetical protein Anas_01921 [Armadillidium nasatum]
MWPSDGAKPINKSSNKRSAEDGDDWAYRGFEDMRSRHPMFRMPNWMSEDDDISNLASRMSHSPHFSSMGRRGHPTRERPGSGGSGVDEDGVDGPNIDRGFLNTNSPNAVRIPIRIEAEAPPGCMPVQPQGRTTTS